LSQLQLIETVGNHWIKPRQSRWRWRDECSGEMTATCVDATASLCCPAPVRLCGRRWTFVASSNCNPSPRLFPPSCPRRAELPAHSCRLAVIRVVSQADSPHGGLACKLRANGQPTDTVPRSPSTISLSKCLIILIQCCEISGDESLLVLDDFTNLGGI